MTTFEAVLFDPDGTLCQRRQEIQRLYRRASERAGAEPFEGLEALWSALRGPPDLIDDSQVALCPGASAALAGADVTGSVGLVTNGPERRQRGKLDSLGIADRFDARVYALDLPRRKPHTGLPVAWLLDGDSPGPYDPEHVLTSVADVQSLLAGEQ